MANRRDHKNRLLEKGEYQREDGRYMYKYTDAGGHSRCVYSWTLTQTDRMPKGKEIGKCLRELEKEIQKDLMDRVDSFSIRKTTLNEYFERFMEQKREVKESTRILYRKNYYRYAEDSIGRMKVAEVKRSDFKKFFGGLVHERGLKRSSAATVYNIFHMMFSEMMSDALIRTNPVDGVLAEVVNRHEKYNAHKRSLTREEQDAFLNFVKNSTIYSRYFNLMIVLLGTGARIGEVLGLTENDCDFDGDMIRIDHAISYTCEEKNLKHYSFRVAKPKTAKGKREIPMFPEVKRALRDEIEKRNASVSQSVEIDGYSGFVFLTYRGTPFNATNILSTIYHIVSAYNSQEMQKAKAENRAPLLPPKFSPHVLRHTFCTRMCENIRNMQELKVVQDVMGHADIKMTMDVYNEASQSQKQDAFARIAREIGIF